MKVEEDEKYEREESERAGGGRAERLKVGEKISMTPRGEEEEDEGGRGGDGV